MLRAGDTCLIACSGGGDSMALTARLAEDFPQADLHVASVDHGLRGAAGAADVVLAGQLAERLGLPFHALRVSPGRRDDPGSLEARARSARYAALRLLAQSIGARYLAVAHTMEDQAETVWMRIRRGTGPRGLAAMRPLRPLLPEPRVPEAAMPWAPGAAVQLWRPLLAERRTDLRAYLATRGIAFSEDATNEDRRFARNRVRHDELPALARVLGGDVVLQLARLATAAQALDDEAGRLLDAWGPVAAAAELRRLPAALRRAMLARAYGRAGGDPGVLTRRHLARVLRVVRGAAVAASLPSGLEARRSGGRLTFSHAASG